MSTPKIHFYGLVGACSVAPHILLHESGLDFTKTIYKKEDLAKIGGYPEELKKLNPKAKVPVATFDNEVVTENPAIFTYISLLAPSKHLFGKTPLETVRVYEWLNYLSGTLHTQAYGMFYAPQRFVDVEDGSLNEHVLARAKTLIQGIYKYIDGKLEGKKWAVGDDFTAADAYLYIFYRWGVAPAQFDMEEYPNYTRLAKAVAARPSTLAVLKAEGLN
ncbi:glutathione S-transferase [Karstenula rhodostoma CBS 690.94]|uniref:Glutathione S-transferase n=1 Tax=Karstenula rhodostoma CBS 690.94 TaxID=1392251 RepID=A0A9P4PXU2_9PLEO|nr:glutathione S-transferase [Karstenula rhodostoma CBS 690.94]